MLRKLRRSLLRADQTVDNDKTVLDLDTSSSSSSSYCHSCGQHTPNRSTFGSFSSRTKGRGSWTGLSAASDSGYESLDSGSGSGSSSTHRSECPMDDARSIASSVHPPQPQPPQQTYSFGLYGGLEDTGARPWEYQVAAASDARVHLAGKRPARQQIRPWSVHSSDVPAPLEVRKCGAGRVEEVEVDVEEEDQEDGEEESEGRHPSWDPPSWGPADEHRARSQAPPPPPPRSRFARLNDLPVASPRASQFTDFDYLFALDAGIQRQEPEEKTTQRRSRRWRGSAASFSLGELPTKLRRLSRLSSKQQD